MEEKIIIYCFAISCIFLCSSSTWYISLLTLFPGDVRVRSRAGFERERRGSHPYIDFRIFHCKYLIVVQ
uniref:Uncharacterized protein n=1 Tax=Pseudonaja textilis TaxID=8673 RepID=A0A670ZJJ0_PSETE